ncbi:MAG: DUF6295 family protein [Acidimicrobiales bacterium]|jgi:hypothetical protein
MCTYQSARLELNGSGKGPEGWFPISDATVYFDHPVHYPAEHSLNIDFLNFDGATARRVAVELDTGSARDLARAILETLETAGEA